MAIIKDQDIILYAPKSNVLLAVFMGIICLPIGIAIPLLAGWQLSALFCSLLFVSLGLWFGPILVWQLLHNPILIINAEGICCLHPFFRTDIRWDETDSIYPLNSGTALAVDLSPTGLVSFFSRSARHLPKHLGITIPQQVLIIRGVNIPLPVNQLLTQIREKFSLQLARYNIDLDDQYAN